MEKVMRIWLVAARVLVGLHTAGRDPPVTTSNITSRRKIKNNFMGLVARKEGES